MHVSSFIIYDQAASTYVTFFNIGAHACSLKFCFRAKDRQGCKRSLFIMPAAADVSGILADLGPRTPIL